MGLKKRKIRNPHRLSDQITELHAQYGGRWRKANKRGSHNVYTRIHIHTRVAHA